MSLPTLSAIARAAAPAALGARIIRSSAIRERRGRDGSYHPAELPDAVCTGEHGGSYGKMHHMTAEHDEPALAAMRMLQRARSAEDPGSGQGRSGPGGSTRRSLTS